MTQKLIFLNEYISYFEKQNILTFNQYDVKTFKK